MLNKSVRVPMELIEKIDYYVDEKKYFSSRADFVICGMRQLIYTYAEKKLEYTKQYKIPLTKESIENVFSAVTVTYLEAFEKYGGENIQINIRTPEGLWDQISKLLKREYGYSKKTDFPRASVMCLLGHLNTTDAIMDDTERFIKEQDELRQQLYDIVIEGMKKNLTGQEIIDGAIQQMMNKK